MLYKSREEWGNYSGNYILAHKEWKKGQEMVKTERWLMVLVEGKNVNSKQIQLSFFMSLWFLVGETGKDRKQCDVSRVCPRLSHLTEGWT